jgi:hypothetical protein
MSIVYTDPGQMDRQIDIWDQPSEPNPDGSKPDPVVFATGVYAQIIGVLATTESTRLKEQVITKITHKIVIRYMKGLRSRMFLLYRDPDLTFDLSTPLWQQGRRFDPDRIVDPDEHKVELWIAAIERNDGQ